MVSCCVVSHRGWLCRNYCDVLHCVVLCRVVSYCVVLCLVEVVLCRIVFTDVDGGRFVSCCVRLCQYRVSIVSCCLVSCVVS